jgi:hypothetical protein
MGGCLRLRGVGGCVVVWWCNVRSTATLPYYPAHVGVDIGVDSGSGGSQKKRGAEARGRAQREKERKNRIDHVKQPFRLDGGFPPLLLLV